jgi:hypothetical protein
MKHSTTRMLFAYWDSLRGERLAPERGEIEPGHIRHILADTFILEVGQDKKPGQDQSTMFRLAGTRMCALFGRELKMVDFHHLWSDDEKREAGKLVDVVSHETAGIVAGLTATTTHGHTIDLEMLLLPLRHRGKTHSRILGALSPLTIPTWMGVEHVKDMKTLSIRIIWPSGTAAALPQEEAAIERRRRFVLHRGGRT